MPITSPMYEARATAANEVTIRGRFTGAGAAVATVPTTGDGSGAPNYAVSSTRSAAGTFVFLFSQFPTQVYDLSVQPIGPTKLIPKVTAYSVANRTVSVLFEIDDGTDTDPETTDTIIISVTGPQA